MDTLAIICVPDKSHLLFNYSTGAYHFLLHSVWTILMPWILPVGSLAVCGSTQLS